MLEVFSFAKLSVLSNFPNGLKYDFQHQIQSQSLTLGQQLVTHLFVF